ncbi:MAG: arsenate reductase ArsC [Dehalococcoidia bacterium]|nr:arsenate reductase ArsC [Dehalococcoidia bacterium]
MVETWMPRTATDLAEELGNAVPMETILGYLEAATEHLRSVSAVETFIPVLAERMARERAQALAQAEGLATKDAPEVLFVCVHNAGRSQMAAVLTKAMSGGRVNVRSAGSTPASEINANVVKAIEEEGLDLSQEFPKPLTDEAVRAADVVITMGCGDACPVYPGKRYLDWQIPDPAGQPIEVVRWIREDIRSHVTGLLGDLGVEVVSTESSRA